MIEFQGVSKTYADGTQAVSDFSLVAESRETTVLVGTSGSGKTTVLRMVNRMVEPTSGRVLWDGEDVAGMDRVKLRRSIGYVLQEGGLFPHWTVLDNISTVPRLEGAGKREAARRAAELLELVGLDQELGKRYPAQLSGGQRQRVGVARALANEPLLLLMDEPFGALDPLVRRDLHIELKRIRETLGTTILMVTHDMHEAMTLGHKVVVMRAGGKVVQQGSPADIVSAPADAFVHDLLEAGGIGAYGKVTATLTGGKPAIPHPQNAQPDVTGAFGKVTATFVGTDSIGPHLEGAESSESEAEERRAHRKEADS